MSINKLDNLTRRLNKAMRTTLLNCDQDELTRLSSTVSLDTWQTIGRLLRTNVTLHPDYAERIVNRDKDYYFNKAFDEKLAQQEKAKKEYDWPMIEQRWLKMSKVWEERHKPRKEIKTLKPRGGMRQRRKK